MFGKKKVPDKNIASPLDGKLIALSDVKDEVFSQGVLGLGAAIIPGADDQGKAKLYAPADGRVDSIADMKHAICIVADNGAEIMIHIGMDTVTLKGAPFDLRIKTGKKIKKGDLLAVFDVTAIKNAGLDTATPVVIANTADYANVRAAPPRDVRNGEDIIFLE